jgi:hypothetical protein
MKRISAVTLGKRMSKSIGRTTATAMPSSRSESCGKTQTSSKRSSAKYNASDLYGCTFQRRGEERREREREREIDSVLHFSLTPFLLFFILGVPAVHLDGVQIAAGGVGVNAKSSRTHQADAGRHVPTLGKRYLIAILLPAVRIDRLTISPRQCPKKTSAFKRCVHP